MTVETAAPVHPGFVQRLISFMSEECWRYTGGGINRVSQTHVLRFSALPAERREGN